MGDWRSAPPPPRPTSSPVVDRLRWVAARGIAAVVAGGLVLGLGGRLVMFASRLLHPDAVGRVTENGNVVGEFTLGGTVALLVFGGLLSGAMAGVVWVVVREWLPGSRLVVAVAVVGIGGAQLVDGTNRDFDVLAPPAADIGLLLGLLVVFGLVLSALDGRVGSLVERPTTTATSVAAIAVAVGGSLAVPTVATFFSRSFCFCEDPPIWTGLGLVVAAAGTTWWWVADARGAAEPPRGAVLLGRAGTLAAVALGALDLADEVRVALS